MTEPNKDNKLAPTHIGAGGIFSPLDPANEADVIAVLQSSLYPGAKPESVRLVIGYCRLQGLDPLKKPVHIVPMKVKTMIPNPSYKEGTNSPREVETYVERDVIMPGVGLYRTDASRAGDYIGKTRPEFGPVKTLTIGNISVDYPEWCRMTFKKLVGSEVAEFEVEERWLENYATAGRDTLAPNSMWRKRPFAQLAKCTEAQGLRIGWPETVGSAPTAEEMEGKTINEDSLADMNAAQTAMVVDKTRERTENLKREMGVTKETPTGTGPVIDVQPTTPTKNEPHSKEPPPGPPASVGETTAQPPNKTAPVAEEATPLPVPGEPLVLDGITFPINLKSVGTKDRINLTQYQNLQTEAERLRVDLQAETERLLHVMPDDLSKEAAGIYLDYLKGRKSKA